jgi:glycosyltransferase involved in cell wall biosynthesis
MFITPASTRSGAPLLMLHLIRQIQKHPDYELSAVLANDGVMTESFTAILPTQIFEPFTAHSLFIRGMRRVPVIKNLRRRANVKKCRKVVGVWPPDVVFCNSAGAAGVLDAMGPYRCPAIVYVHELEYVLKAIDWVPGGAPAAMSRNATHYIAGSKAVGDNLAARHAVPKDRITVVHDFIDTSAFSTRDPSQGRPIDSACYERFHLPEKALVVGAIGTTEWRKGADLFVALARLLPEKDSRGRPIHLIWVGGGKSEDVAQLAYDVQTAQLTHRVHLAGSTSRTADWYPNFDVLVMLSREDPMPLVPLEAAASGLPIVCFADTGGLTEFVEDDAGIIVPYMDLQAFARATVLLLEDEALRVKLGQTGGQKVRARHDVSVATPRILSCIDRLVGR